MINKNTVDEVLIFLEIQVIDRKINILYKSN